MQVYIDKVLAFFYQVFTFGITQSHLEEILGFQVKMTDTEYYLLLIGLWIACLVFTWLILWAAFKVWKLVFC